MEYETISMSHQRDLQHLLFVDPAVFLPMTLPSEVTIEIKGKVRKRRTKTVRHPFTAPDGKIWYGNMASQRFECFSKSLVCACCGIVGSKFALDLSDDLFYPHFNLYAEWENKLVLMTKDHIQPRSLGGKDVVENMQTMCCVCNNYKGKLTVSLEELRQESKIKDWISKLTASGYFGEKHELSLDK